MSFINRLSNYQSQSRVRRGRRADRSTCDRRLNASKIGSVCPRQDSQRQ